jgi:hypothetical protein
MVLKEGVGHSELAEVGEDAGAVGEVGDVRKVPATEVEVLD